MTDETVIATQPQTALPMPPEAPTTAVQSPPVAQPRETLQGEDRAIFEMAKMKRQLSVAMAEKVLAQTEASESEFKCTLMRLYMKLGLNPDLGEGLDEQGNITRKAQ